MSMYRVLRSPIPLPKRVRRINHFVGWMPSPILAEFIRRTEPERVVYVFGVGRFNVTWEGRKLTSSEAVMVPEVIRKWRDKRGHQ